MLFITGTGTGVGKTFVTALIARQLRAAGRSPRVLKPVLSGYDPALTEDSDPGVLLRALGVAPTPEAIDRVSPWRFAAPLSPCMAAAREGRAVPFDDLVGFCRAEAAAAGPLLIEGVGGAMVPLDDSHTVMDWMAALRCPALVVGGAYLGAISHCLTTVEAMRGRGVPVAAIVLSEAEPGPVPAAETAAVIARFTGLDVRVVARGDGPQPDLCDLAV